MESMQRLRRRANGGGSLSMEVTVPPHFRCPISLDLMKDPVTVSTGITYDRHSIEKWLAEGGKTCPVTKQPLDAGHDPIPNHSIRRMIQDWCVAHRSLGVERIPTPKTPLAPAQVADLLAGISSASSRGEQSRCEELVRRLRAAAKESERNRRCVASSNAAGRVLATAFAAFASLGRQQRNSTTVLLLLVEILAVVSPLDRESCSCLIASDEALRSLLWILKQGDLAGRVNAITVIKEVVISSSFVKVLKDRDDEGGGDQLLLLLEAALVDFMREPISPGATKAALAACFHLAASSREARRRFAEVGAVELLVEMLADSSPDNNNNNNRSVSEKALGVLDSVCECEEGRESARGNALVVPVLVKKMFRVSDLATEFAVSALWKLLLPCEARGGGGRRRRDAPLLSLLSEAGAFQKLLLLLQVGCRQPVKVKATELLKLLNAYDNKEGIRRRLDCMEAVDLKGLKRPPI